MAGVEGFEPSHGDTKNRCLTAWLHPNVADAFIETRLSVQGDKRGKITLGVDHLPQGPRTGDWRRSLH